MNWRFGNAGGPSRAIVIAVSGVIAVTPCLALLPHLLAGRIPFFMDPVMYFLPLRMHAAELIATGQLPFWNRTLLGGMPLLANPQAAVVYPANWPFLLAPSGTLWLLPQLLQFGLWALLSALLLRRFGAGNAGALFAAALLLAGDYGWGRLQYGNFMNALPWWPLWLASGLAFADAEGRVRSRRPLAVGALAVAMSLLSGAHQIASYGLSMCGLALAAYSCRTGGGAARFAIFGAVTGLIGVAVGAPGWLPQSAFLAETARGAKGLAAAEVLQGTFPGLRQVLLALVEPMTPGVADAEASATIGLFALAAAAVRPDDPGRRRLWSSLWGAIIVSVLLTLEPAMRLLVSHVPFAGAFHGPRRMIGVTQWLIALAAGLAVGDAFSPRLGAGEQLRPSRWLRFIPAVALIIAGAFVLAGRARAVANGPGLLSPIPPVAIAAAWIAVQGARRPAGHAAILLLLAVSLLACRTAMTTDFAMIPMRELIDAARSHPAHTIPADPDTDGMPARYLSLDRIPASSYDYRRPDRAAWLLPNLGAIAGMEDIGGYEPARSVRYERWFRTLNAWPGGAQPWERNFALAFPSAANIDELARASVRFAVLPSAGPALYLQRVRSADDPDAVILASLLPPDAGPALLTIRFGPGEKADADRRIDVHRGGAPAASIALDATNLADSTDDRRLHKAEVELPGGFTAGTSAQPPWIMLRLAPGDSAPEVFLMPGSIESVLAPAADTGTEPDPASPRLFRVTTPSRWISLHRTADLATIPFELAASEISANRISLSLRHESPAAATLTLRDAWWPGWTATVNGAPEEVRPSRSGSSASGPWREIDLPPPPPQSPPGPHEETIVLEYFPPRLGGALALSAAGIVSLFALLVVGNPGRSRSDFPGATPSDS